MKMAIVYSSKTGNTKELVELICDLLLSLHVKVERHQAGDFPLSHLQEYDAIIIGTYTWGDGDIPTEMLPLYKAFEKQDVKHIVTGVIGTGDHFYPHFCGAVDKFRDMLNIRTNLAVTLKVELAPQTGDLEKCDKFVQLLLKRIETSVFYKTFTLFRI